MAARRRLLVVTDSGARFQGTPYQLRAVAEAWVGQGGELLVSDDPDALPDADVTIAHIDLTVVPPAFQRAFARRGGVLNARVTDISKRRVSSHLLRSPDEWDGPVIVKTDRNHGGWPELDALRTRGLAGRAIARVVRTLPWQLTGLLSADSYPIYPHPRQVPWFVWRHPALVVERLRTERRPDGLYALRQHVFLGDRRMDSVVCGPSPIVKASNVVLREAVEEPPPELTALKAELGFDFGKFDYTVSDGEVVIFDVNRTPSFGDNDAERMRRTAAILAPGLDGFLPDASRSRERRGPAVA